LKVPSRVVLLRRLAASRWLASRSPRCGAGGADAHLQLDAATLLNDMRDLVRDGVQIATATQDDVAARRGGIGTHGPRGSGGLGACVSLDRRRVVAPERALDRVRERGGA
jgi:hypothetical protein